MSLLLLLSPAGPVGAPPNVDAFVRRIDSWELNYALGNTATFRCILIDKRPDRENAYRPANDLRVEVRRSWDQPIFRGRIVQVADAPLEEPNVGTKYSITCVGEAEVFESRHVTATFGADPQPVQISYPAAGVGAGSTLIATFVPHGLSVGDIITLADVTHASGVKSLVNGEHIITSIQADLPASRHFSVASTLQVGEAYGGTVRARVHLRTILQALEDPYLTDYGYSLAPDIALGPLLEVQKFDNATVNDIFRHMSKITGWVHRLLPNRVIEWFEPGQKLSALTFQKINVMSGTGWTQSRLKKANTVILKYGGNQELAIQESVAGDAVKREFALVHKPVVVKPITSTSVRIALTVPEGPGGAMVPRHVGVHGYDLSFEWVYRESDNKLVQLDTVTGVGQPIKPVGWVGVALITEQLPATVRVNDPALVAIQGPREKLVEAPGIVDRNAALQLAYAELTGLSITPKEGKFITEEGLTWPGNSAEVYLPHLLMTGQFLITGVNASETEREIRYTYTALEGNQFTAGWQEKLRNMFGGGSGGTVLSGSVSTYTGGGGGGGGGLFIGTKDKIAVFKDAMVLGDSIITQSPDLNLVSTPAAIESVQGFRSNIFKGITAGAIDLVVQNAAGAAVFQIPTGTVDAKFSGKVITNVVTSATDLELGGASQSVYPTGNYITNLGGFTRKWRSLFAGELYVETLVAQDVMSTIGGSIWVGPTTTLEADVSMVATSIVVKHNQMSVGDRVMLKAHLNFEIMVITGGPTGTGPYTYTVTRDYDGSGATAWFAGDSIANTGQVGTGHIELYSINSARTVTEIGPTQVFNVRTGTGAVAWEPRVAVGNLRALYDFSSAVNNYGIAAGVRTGAWFSVDPVNGFRMMFNNTVFAQITAAGAASFTGSVTVTGGNAAKTDLTNVTVGTVIAKTGWGHPSDTTLINGANIYTGSVTLTQLNFVPATTANVVATINASSEGIRIAAAKIHIDGTVTFGLGYNPATKIDAGQAAADINANVTTISGARITTGSIAAEKLAVTDLSAISANIGNITAGNISGVNISGTTITGSTINGGTITGVTISGVTINVGPSNNIVLNSAGISIPVGTSVSGYRINLGDSQFWGGSGSSGLYCSGGLFAYGQIGTDSNLFAQGHAIIGGDIILGAGRIFWSGPPTTNFQDRPVVWSSGNTQLFTRNDCVADWSGTPSSIHVRGGLVVSIS